MPAFSPEQTFVIPTWTNPFAARALLVQKGAAAGKTLELDYLAGEDAM